MQVTLIGSTTADLYNMRKATEFAWDPGWASTEADDLAEFAGRACYQSWNKPNPETRENADYLRSTIHEKGHESIAAHASATFYIEGVSRNLTHELIRHRWLAFSELSQRYVDMHDSQMVIPPAIRGLDHEYELHEEYNYMLAAYEDLVRVLERRYVTGKQAREAARAVLPGGVETKIVVSGNMRAWRDFLKQRWSAQADAEIRELAGHLLNELRRLAPNTFADIPEKPYGIQDAE
ncbi:FAD-dependent thymidylate synthase [Nonomuraea sp. NPDC059007]|uniref:FAD-dependent thymidylate synthase n=1 Tax=Nonomuraea sp. NPDC059007 TaxID=3346692 RepID=UPI0036A7A8AB